VRVRVLGIDPGTLTTGYGVVESERSRLHHVDNGLVVAKKGTPLEERLALIFAGIETVIERFKPDKVAVESVFSHRNTRSALALGHARGVILLAAARQGLEVSSYAPALIKKTVTGSGRADKHQIQMMVKTLLGLPEVPAEDAADALAMAICHCHHQSAATPAGLAPPKRAHDRTATRPRR